MRSVRLCFAVLMGVLTAHVAAAEGRPNILWLSVEDISANIGCYGDPDAVTPNLDKLAAEGVRYSKAFTAAPVCAPNRASIITGLYQTTVGGLHMRSTGEGKKKTPLPALPAEVRLFPEYLRRAGYYCTNNSKEDYNVGPTPPETWDESSNSAHWKNRPDPKQPFFAVINFQGTHEGQILKTGSALAKMTEGLGENERHDPARILVPAHHPDTPAVRRQWANYHDLISAMDHWIAKELRELDEAGLAENTVVMFWSDHGAGLPRHKRWIYDSGTHIPLIVRLPKSMQGELGAAPGTVDDQLVSSIDLAPTVLTLAGVALPGHLQGRPFLGKDLPAPHTYVFSARDRMDERYDTIRSVRDGQYRYLRNYQPWIPYSQYINSCEKGDVQKELRRLAKAGALPEGCRWFGLAEKPAEELYDMAADPYSLKNLAGDPAQAERLGRMRAVQSAWIRETRDLGFLPEATLVRLEAKFGSRYDIYAGMERESPGFWETLYGLVDRVGRTGAGDVAALTAACGHAEGAIRYWGMVLLGRQEVLDAAAVALLEAATKDAAPEVRVAAAEALLRHGQEEAAQVTLLAALLADEDMWVRVLAATALDGAGEKARGAIPALRVALEDPYNKYVVRVANHALNELTGTEVEVP